MANPFNRKSYRPLQPSQRVDLNSAEPQTPERHQPNAPASVSESELVSAPTTQAPNAQRDNATTDAADAQTGTLQLFTETEVVRLLQVDAEMLQTWVQIFRASLTEYTRGYNQRYSSDDISTLFFIGNLADSGYTNDQIASQLIERRKKLIDKEYAEIEIVGTEEVPSIPLENNVTFRERVPDYKPEPMPSPIMPPPQDLAAHNGNGYPADGVSNPIAESGNANIANRQVNELLSTVATSQQSVLNIQDSLRETIGVVVQDNFNLKHENRKLRERMLEIERSLAEQQRREETRKEISEGRLRAVEGTLAAMQQQLAQLIQFQRNRGQGRRNRFW